MAKKPITLECKREFITTKNLAELRKQFAKAGFAMVGDKDRGWVLRSHGLPALDTGLAGAPHIVRDYTRGLIIFTDAGA